MCDRSISCGGAGQDFAGKCVLGATLVDRDMMEIGT